MAKEFKDFDKKYKHLAGTALKTVIESCGLPKDAVIDVDRWPFVSDFTEDYDNHDIRHAVYLAGEAETWQQFRVSLKGLSTKEKLYCLMWYWGVHVTPGAGAHRSLYAWKNEKIRVNNYLGALKRGGQLDSNLHVIK
jgi:hypothetical protein